MQNDKKYEKNKNSALETGFVSNDNFEYETVSGTAV